MKGRSTDLLVVRGNCKVDKNFMDQLSAQERPSFVMRAGTGMDNLDTSYLDSLGIEYVNTPDVNTQSTAELALGLILNVKRKITHADSAIKSGKWDRAEMTGTELGGKTLGIIGLGRIGSVLGAAAKTLGMEVIGLASPRQQNPTHELPVYLSETVSLSELCSRADVLSLHVPLNDSTRGMIGKQEIAQLSGRNAVVINTARGGVVDEKALLEALDRGDIGGAGLDVFVHDPAPLGSISDRLAKHPRVVATPHVGGQTVESSEKMADAVINQARTMFLNRVSQPDSLNS
jgi:D-3-phosphoglycerate dehydrogenase